MQYLLPGAVFLLMVSVGMSLKLTEVVAHWRRLGWSTWLCLLFATFIVPPALALLVANLFRLTMGETVGLFMVGVAPGAPLLTRNLARRGFDMHMAASYQVWAALMVPVMIPIVVAAAGKLYGRDIWIPPAVLLKQILLKQFLPLSVGMGIAGVAPKISQRLQPVLNVLGNIALTAMIAVVLIKMGPALKALTPLVPVAALLLAVGSIATMLPFRFSDPLVKETFAICNANRHVGLALLLTGQYVRARNGLPTVACYALLAPLIMFAYVKWHRSPREIAAMGRGNWKLLAMILQTTTVSTSTGAVASFAVTCADQNARDRQAWLEAIRDWKIDVYIEA
jgi:BASS family bile acid:Na+ symporter